MRKASSEGRLLLLDVNALMALAWPTHQFHTAVVTRLERRPVPRWATCALTQLGFVRLSSNPKIVETRKTPAEVVGLLTALTGDERHVYLETLPALPDIAGVFRGLLGHQQVTDAYLLGVAAAGGATLLTLDRRVVPPGTTPAHVEVLTP
jgi:toxin-antitoxin system PIN domain toxin